MKWVVVALTVVSSFVAIDVYAWGNKEAKLAKKQAKAEAKVQKKSEKQKNGIKNWQMTRFRYADVTTAIEKNGKLTPEDIAVKANVEEVQSVLDGLIAGYVTVVNILDGYVEIEEGNAVAGLVATKVENGKSVADAVGELTADEKTAYDKYIEWIKDGETAGKLAIADEDLEKIMTAGATAKEQMSVIKEKVKGQQGMKMALAKDLATLAKIGGSTAKGGMMLKGILEREKKAKKLLVVDK